MPGSSMIIDACMYLLYYSGNELTLTYKIGIRLAIEVYSIIIVTVITGPVYNQISEVNLACMV